MSAITGCYEGAKATGLVDPNVRADAYSSVTEAMNLELAQHGLNVHVSRADAKQALMTSFYGSKLTPKTIFGEETPELQAFYVAAQKVAPGAWDLLQDLLASWQPWTLKHSWQLPDGFEAKVKVMQKHETRIEVDELDHASFTYEHYENTGSRTGLSNVANVVHSIDALVLREIHRRCNYKTQALDNAVCLVQAEQGRRLLEVCQEDDMIPDAPINKYVGLWARTGFLSAVVIPYLNEDSVRLVPWDMLKEIEILGQSMMDHNPFPVVTIHDEFKCHPNNMNHLRQHYINILAELADSVIIDDILSQLHGKPGNFPKLSNNLSDCIRHSNYALS